MDKERSRPRTSSSKGSRGDSEARWDWNLESDRIHFSPRWVALAGCEDHEVGNAPEDWFRKVHPEDQEKFEREIETARFGDATTFECQYRLRHKDGTYRWMSCRGMVVRDNAGRAIRLSGSESDVTVTMVTDRLTRLPNRLLLVDRVTQSIERARRYKGFHFALLMIDLGTPTSLGHSSTITDTLLTAVARRLETCLRLPGSLPSVRHNDLVARMEGHYFAILLDGLRDIGHAKIAADRILGELLNPFTVGGREVRLSASIGIALSATGYGTADEVLTDAETALHRARVLGGSHCEVFDTDILKSEQTELQLEGDLEGALQRREFVLFYQPIVSLESNEVLGFESLLRWRHPVLGMIAPLDFIPIAERTGFIVPLGAWVLHEACRRLAEWHRSLSLGDDLWVSVNISSAQLTDPTLIDQIQLALHDSGLEPRRLALELTEGIAIANPSAVTTLLMELRAVGVRICVDDFGTGYSSLAYLRQFPIDTLKIDRSFVRGMVTNKDTAEIVAGVMNLSKQLGLRVVAEGVEDEDQCDHLRALNCHAGQGHLFAKPLDLDGAVEVLKTGLAPRPERRRETTLAPEGETIFPQLFVRGRRLVTRRVASFAAAIVALLSAGVLSVVKIIEPASSDPVRPPAPTITRDRTVEPPAAPSAPPVTTKEVARVQAPARLPAPRAGASSPSLAAASAKVAQTLPLDVVHLHRFGDCRGQLDVSRDGVAFLSQHDSDTFTLKFAEFLHALSDDTLTLKSATKTYRFKAAASGSDGTRKLREFADRIARARR
ncbi:MAG TPA: EAL domain-containing protein [Vicinamibacterales bacterium]|nr:EAL domain-containing protein [Vicinamibacterales bacterium]